VVCASLREEAADEALTKGQVQAMLLQADKDREGERRRMAAQVGGG
jgi:hypothetical protein